LTTIRLRLGAALALALLPILLLGVVEASVAFHRDAEDRRMSLGLAADRSAATARARMASAAVLLQTLAPQAVGFDCAQRLAELRQRLDGYDNLIRLDARGRVTCAAADTPSDPLRGSSDWFQRLKAGESTVVTRAPASLSPAGPAVLAAGPAFEQGRFDGALVAILNLGSLRPDVHDRALPLGTQIALADDQGRFLSRTAAWAFDVPPPPDFAGQARVQGSLIYYGRDSLGRPRVYSAAPLVGDVFVILSAPAEGWFSWARLNPLSGLLLPLLAFTAALLAVWIVADRVVLRWLHYLQRIAAIYAKGRFSVRPIKAEHAPPEIHELAQTLETMAAAIEARDASLRESLFHKDALMREIHHRVKNNLQVITSLLNLQQRTLYDPAARMAMSDTRQRIVALALIYRALYQGPDLKRVDLKPFLAELVGELVLERPAQEGLVRTELEADELIIDPDKLAPLALFAVEAIGNAQKHALTKHGGLLSVRFKVRGEEAELSVSDEGAGEAAPAPQSDGVGRALMTAFARQLKGRMEVGPNTRGGVTAVLVFPTPSLSASPRPAGRGKTKPKVEPTSDIDIEPV
jgi:two-component sensor histidine kinase